MISVLIFLGLVSACWYLLISRPQQQQQDQHKQVIGQLNVGDHVMTIGGIFGSVVAIAHETVLLEVAPNITTQVAKDGISRVMPANATAIFDKEQQEAVGRLGSSTTNAATPTGQDDQHMYQDPNQQHQQYPQQQRPYGQPQYQQAPAQYYAAPVQQQHYGAPAPAPVPAPQQYATPMIQTHSFRAQVSQPLPLSNSQYAPPAHGYPAPQFAQQPPVQHAPGAPSMHVAQPVLQPHAAPVAPPLPPYPAQQQAPQYSYQPTPAPTYQQPVAHGYAAPAPQYAVQAPQHVMHAPQYSAGPQHYAPPVEASPQHGSMRSAPPEGFGQTVKVDGELAREFDRARRERAELAEGYRQVMAPLVAIDEPDSGGLPMAPPQHLQQAVAPSLAPGYPAPAPLFVTQQQGMPAPQVRRTAVAQLPGERSPFSRPTPYAPQQPQELQVTTG